MHAAMFATSPMPSENADRQADRQYWLLSALALVPLFAVFLLVGIYQFFSQRQAELDHQATLAADLAQQLHVSAWAVQRHVAEAQYWMEDRLGHPQPVAAHWKSRLLASRDTFPNLDAAGAEDAERRPGNIFAMPALRSRATAGAEIDAILTRFEHDRLAHRTTPQLRWSYFFAAARDMVAIYPWAASKTMLAGENPADSLSTLAGWFAYDIYKLATPEANPERKGYWTEPYLDAGGAGPMVSYGRPVWVGERFRGMVGADLLLTYLQEKIAGFAGKNARLLLVSKGGLILAAHGVAPSGGGPAEGLTGLDAILPEDLLLNRTRLLDSAIPAQLGRHFAMALPVADTGWRLLWMLPAEELNDAIRWRISPVLFVLAALVGSLLVIQHILRRQFLDPVARFRSYVDQLADGCDGTAPVLPPRWQALAETIGAALARTHAAKEKSDARHHQLLEKARDAVVVLDTEGIVREWNQRAETMFGWTKTEAIGHSLSELIVPPEQRAAHESGLCRFAAERTPHLVDGLAELEALRRDGARIPVELSLWTFEDEDGRMLFGAFLRDISARKGAEQAISQSEERYRAVIDNVTEGILVLQGSRIVFANPTLHRLIGYDADEIGRTDFIEFVHPDDRTKVMDRHLRRLRGEAVEPRYDFRVTHKGGAILWFDIGAVQMSWNGAPAVLAFVADITDRKRLEESLRESVEALRHNNAEREAILNATLVGISLVKARRHQWVNRRLAEMLGYTPEELVGQSSAIHFAAPEDWQTIGDVAYAELDAGRSYVGEVRMRRKDGGVFWAQIMGTRVDARDIEQGYIWSYLDISVRHQAEGEIREALARQRELNELRTRFVSMTSHEFRTPLATILSSEELLRHYGDKLPAVERDNLYEAIEGAVCRMTAMLENILLIGRADAERLDYRPLPVDLAAFCRQLADEARSAAPQDCPPPDLVLDFALPDDPLPVDEKLLRHVLGNLLSNAIKYSPRGGQVRFAARRAEDDLEFAVEDQGIGIPDEDLPSLFETFHRAGNVGNIHGTGLGLAIVKRAVERMEGRIDVRSTVGVGTRFLVRIPIPEIAA
jgi:PAS domain S-box-containing protein